MLTRYISAAALMAFSLLPFTVEARDMTPAPTRCAASVTFDSEEALSSWRTVLDGVMGGRSSGNRFFQNDDTGLGYMAFRGVINTNGGGFSSVRTGLVPGDLGEANAMRVRLRQDDRNYLLTFYNDQAHRGRRISFAAPIPNPEPGSKDSPGEWVEVVVPFDTITGDVIGRTVPVPEGGFDAGSIRGMGIEIADGVDGSFAVDVAGLECVRVR